MKKSRYSDSQILSILKQNKAGALVPYLCRECVIRGLYFCNGYFLSMTS